MMSLSTATEYAQGMLEKGELADVSAANVHIVRMMGVRIIRATIPREVRIALSAAVKEGRLGRLAKSGLMPEAFFHPNAKAEAMVQRERIARESVQAIKGVMA